MKDKECFDKYLGKDIKYEMIELISNRILKTVILSVKGEKYISVIIHCTPDTSHKEQLSILLQCVEISQKQVKVKDLFFFYSYISVIALVQTYLTRLCYCQLMNAILKEDQKKLILNLKRSKQQNICNISPPTPTEGRYFHLCYRAISGTEW